jgi:hypothetical protein
MYTVDFYTNAYKFYEIKTDVINSYGRCEIEINKNRVFYNLILDEKYLKDET